MDKKYLAIFDLDGTLFDTGDVNYYAYKDALALYGIELDREYFINKCNSRHYKEFLPVILGGNEHVEAVHEAKKMSYVKNLDKARENRHLFEILKSMRKEYHTAIVTTASRQNVMDILRHFGYESLFEFMVTQEDIVKAKPDPQGFLMCMEHFGTDRDHTVIFEDSEVGIKAAKATGAAVFVVEQM